MLRRFLEHAKWRGPFYLAEGNEQCDYLYLSPLDASLKNLSDCIAQAVWEEEREREWRSDWLEGLVLHPSEQVRHENGHRDGHRYSCYVTRHPSVFDLWDIVSWQCIESRWRVKLTTSLLYLGTESAIHGSAKIHHHLVINDHPSVLRVWLKVLIKPRSVLNILYDR